MGPSNFLSLSSFFSFFQANCFMTTLCQIRANIPQIMKKHVSALQLQAVTYGDQFFSVEVNFDVPTFPIFSSQSECQLQHKKYPDLGSRYERILFCRETFLLLLWAMPGRINCASRDFATLCSSSAPLKIGSREHSFLATEMYYTILERRTNFLFKNV